MKPMDLSVGSFTEYPTPSELQFYPLNTNKELVAEHWFKPWEAKPLAMKEGETKIVELGRAPLPTDFGDYTYIAYGDKSTGEHHNVLVYGNFDEGSLGDGEDVLTRVHSACWTNEVSHASNCECRKEIQETLTQINKEGRGVFVYLQQEGRGTGIAGKMAQLGGMFEWQDGKIEQKRDEQGERIDTDRAYKEAGYPSECRDFSVAGEILQDLGVKSVRLLTNNPLKIKAVEDFGIVVTPVNILVDIDNEIVRSDLRSKAINLGHSIPKEHYENQERQI